jgi:hypothetical protein
MATFPVLLVEVIPAAAIGWIGAINDIAQVVALALGGLWTYRLFVRQRQNSTRANVTHASPKSLSARGPK